MEKIIELDQLTLEISADEIRETRDDIRLNGSRVTIRLPRPPSHYFRHGWQSWSLAAWTDLTSLPIQKPKILHPLQTDPLYVNEPNPNGSWLGAVEFEVGKTLLLGALGTDAHVRLNGTNLEGCGEAGPVEWLVAYGEEESVFADYVELLAGIFGQVKKKPAPRIWCSWYSLYTAIDEALLNKTFAELGDLPFDVLQVDDGWQVGIGDWEANKKFPAGMRALAERIQSTGRKAGLWLAPLIASSKSGLFREHRDWFLKDARGRFVSAGFNWGQQLHALDTTHPAALEWLAALMKQVRAWGFDYLKLDFLYAGALPGKRRGNLPREAAYRNGLKVLREAMGEDAFFLACGAPIIPSLGLCDALRIGPDVASEWESHRDAVLLSNFSTPGTKNAIRTTLHRLWLNPLVHTDPDVAYFASKRNSLTPEQKTLLQNMALICNFKAASDLPEWLTEVERESLAAFLEAKSKVKRTGRYTFQIDKRSVDFSTVPPLSERARGLSAAQSALIGWLGNQKWALKLLAQMEKDVLKEMKKGL